VRQSAAADVEINAITAMKKQSLIVKRDPFDS
jgi:hypothetical protein